MAFVAVACSSAHPEIIEDVMKMPAIPVNEVVSTLQDSVSVMISNQTLRSCGLQFPLSQQFMCKFRPGQLSMYVVH